MRRILILTALTAILASAASTALADKIRIVAATSDLGYFARQIGGDLVEVDVIASGNRDVHYIEVLPSYMLKVRRAHIYLKVGLELDIWSQPIIDGSRNGSIKVVDCSEGIIPVEVPTFQADARYGDLHRFGNPHYWLSPANVPTICANIAEALEHVDPANATTYESNQAAYLKQLEVKMSEWENARTSVRNIEFVAYHNSWPYFCTYFGCHVVDFVEEFAGVAPSPSHVAHLIEHIKADRIPIVAAQPFHDKRLPKLIAEKTGCASIILPTSVGGVAGSDTYESMIDSIVSSLADAAKGPPR
jgi:ABC-type Zn uptake system ZnuABC Zn-binding protein ZnuA